MKKTSLIFVILTAVLFAASGSIKAEIIDKVIAVVNNEVITQSELDRLLYPIYAQYKEMYNEQELAAKMEAARNELLTQMIEDKLILNAAEKKGITIDEEEAKNYLNDIKNKFGGDDAFKEALVSQGLSVDMLKKRYREQLMMKKIFEREVKSKIVILPTQVQEYYQQHVDEFKEPETVVLRMITLKVSKPEDKEAVLEKAKEVKKKIDAGEKFDELAKQFSEDASAIEGGLVGYVKKGQFMQQIDEAVFKLEAGGVSDIIESELGFHIFKVDEKIPSHTRQFSEARTEIENMFYQEKINQRFEEWMGELKKGAYISIK
ncbi:MAG: peptidylprolyl isomerase [Candidatus Omnitrophota bacterium]